MKRAFWCGLLAALVLLTGWPAGAPAGTSLKDPFDISTEADLSAGVAGPSGVSIFVIHLKDFPPRTESVAVQIERFWWGPDALQDVAGVTIYYATNLLSSDSGHTTWETVDWSTLCAGIKATSSNSGYVRFISSVTGIGGPYLGLKLEWGPYSGTSPCALGLKGSVQ